MVDNTTVNANQQQQQRIHKDFKEDLKTMLNNNGALEPPNTDNPTKKEMVTDNDNDDKVKVMDVAALL